MDENHLSSLPLGGKNQQLSAWICTTCHAGVAWVLTAECTGHTVGGRNPAPVDMVNIPLFTRFLDPGGAGFLPSSVSSFCYRSSNKDSAP